MYTRNGTDNNAGDIVKIGIDWIEYVLLEIDRLGIHN